MTLGTLKCTTIEDDAGNSESVANIVAKAGTASPTFTGTVTMPATVAFAGQASDITLDDNQAAALEIKEDTNAYVTFNTTDSGEQIEVDKAVVASENITLENEKALRLSESGSGSNFIGLKAPADLSDANTTYTLPAAPGTSGHVLSSTDAGVMSWVGKAGTAANTFGGAQSVTISTQTDDGALDMDASNFIHVNDSDYNTEPTGLVVGTSGLFIATSAAPTDWHEDFHHPGGAYTEPTAFPAVAPWYVNATGSILVGTWTQCGT